MNRMTFMATTPSTVVAPLLNSLSIELKTPALPLVFRCSVGKSFRYDLSTPCVDKDFAYGD